MDSFPGLSNIEASLRQIVGAVSTINQTVSSTMATLNTTVGTISTSVTAAFPPPLTSSATWNPPNLASGASTSTTITVTGAVLGNFVQPSFSLDLQGMQLTGNVSSANTVTAVLSNLTGGSIDLASGTLKARVYA